MSTRRATVTVPGKSALDRIDADGFADALDRADPDAVCCPDPSAELALRARRGAIDGVGVLSTDVCPDGTIARRRVGNVDVLLARTDDHLGAIADAERTGDLDPTGETYVVSDRLSVEVDPIALSATLSGLEGYLEALAPDRLEESYTHVTTGAPVGYRRRWAGLTVVGCGPDPDEREPSIPTLELFPDGTVACETTSASGLGLRAVPEIGEKTARRLREAGYRTREEVARAAVLELGRVEGIDTGRAQRLRENARAIVDGEVVRRNEAPLPSGTPVFVDIETDGLSPTIVWLIGVLDPAGGAESSEDAGSDSPPGTYLPFCQRDPDEPAGALEAFLEWYDANAAGRPIVAYNGDRFDFPVIAEHVARHCPAHLDAWERARRFDPYAWAVRRGNAVLPGRTNRLSDVASALGWEGEDTGLDGATVARRYRRWARDRTPESEPDWERHERYCEDDVRALAFVYDALVEARRTLGPVSGDGDGGSEDDDESGGTDDRSTGERPTTQGSLTDFGA